jgi:hypothetical protein
MFWLTPGGMRNPGLRPLQYTIVKKFHNCLKTFSVLNLCFSMWRSALLRFCSLCQGCSKCRQPGGGGGDSEALLITSVRQFGRTWSLQQNTAQSANYCARHLFHKPIYIIKRSKLIVRFPDATALDSLHFGSVMFCRYFLFHSIWSASFHQLQSPILNIKTQKAVIICLSESMAYEFCPA